MLDINLKKEAIKNTRQLYSNFVNKACIYTLCILYSICLCCIYKKEEVITKINYDHYNFDFDVCLLASFPYVNSFLSNHKVK